MKTEMTTSQNQPNRLNANRRNFLKGATAAGLGLTVLTLSTSATTLAQDAPTIGTDPGAQMMKPGNVKEFGMAVIGRAELSLVTSKIAVERASKADAKEFAGFELTEAIAVTTVLKDLGTPVPTMTAKAKATLEKIKNAPAGHEFDKLYIAAQLENHMELRDLTEAYLGHPAPSKSDMAESQGRHLATLSLAVFKEHVKITQRISGELQTGA
jgi:putative membrane protein